MPENHNSESSCGAVASMATFVTKGPGLNSHWHFYRTFFAINCMKKI